MAIESRTKEVTFHKYKRTVFVDLDTKTKIGKDLLDQYKEQTQNHCMDIGRIGRHNDSGKYIIDNYTIRELKVVPKLIIRVLKSAMNRAGKDVYQLRTYMSKFGQLNFLLLVDKDRSDLVLVENIYISNLNHRENYETLIWRINHVGERPVPLKQIFFEYGIKANADDYGKSWKEDIKINNIIVNKARADFSIKVANNVCSNINQKALVTSLNYLNKNDSYGKKIKTVYSKNVAKNKAINELASSEKLENTLNHVLLKTIEEDTSKKDIKKQEDFVVYKKVIDVQFSVSKEIADEVEKQDTKQNLKNYLLEVYEKPVEQQENTRDLEIEFDNEQKEFEKIIDRSFVKETKKEENKNLSEDIFNKNLYKDKNLPSIYKNFENNELKIDFNDNRFFEEETKKEKKDRLKIEKQNNLEQNKKEKRKEFRKKKSKEVAIICSIDEEFDKSKSIIGIQDNISKKKKKKTNFVENQFNKNEETRKKSLNNNKIDKIEEDERTLLHNLREKVKRQTQRTNQKKERKRVDRINKIQAKKERKILLKEKKNLFREYGKKIKQNKKTKNNSEKNINIDIKGEKRTSLNNKVALKSNQDKKDLIQQKLLKKEKNPLEVKNYKIKDNNEYNEEKALKKKMIAEEFFSKREIEEKKKNNVAIQDVNLIKEDSEKDNILQRKSYNRFSFNEEKNINNVDVGNKKEDVKKKIIEKNMEQ